MSASPGPRASRPLLARPKSWLCFVAAGAAIGVATWFATPSIYRRMLAVFWNVDGGAVRIEVDGTVVDARGRPVQRARVHGSWEVFVPGIAERQGHGSFLERTDERGHYRHIQWMTTDRLAAAPAVEVRLTLRAHGRFDECEPADAITVTLPGRSRSTHDLRLGPALPTVPVHVVDAEARPVTEFWVRTMPAEQAASGDDAENWPEAHEHFPDGITDLAMPARPFRVRVHVRGGQRETTVGPFDPEARPARIDVVLPDR
jgi:hypothetical protein